MTNKYSRITVLSLSICLVFTACESHEEKADTAFELYRNEKKSVVTVESSIKSNDVIKDSLMKVAVVKHVPKVIDTKVVEKQDEWVLFKIECEMRIVENEKKIKEITNSALNNPKMLKKAVGIEKENNDIRKEIAEYQEEMKLNLANFKSKINNATFEIKNRLDELVITNK